MFCKLCNVPHNDQVPLTMVGNSWFMLPDLSTGKRLGSQSDDNFDIKNYENRAIYLISALCKKPNICPWPATSNGAPVLNHQQYTFDEPVGRKFLSTPSTIKYFNKKRPFQIAKGLANIDTYAW
jgi:hypothetical protein